MSRLSVGGSFLDSVGIRSMEKTNLAVINGNINSPKYIDTSENYLALFSSAAHDDAYKCMHDNAGPHFGEGIREWFKGTMWR